MNICILATNFLPHQGGAEYTIHYLTQALGALDHGVTILKEQTPDSRLVTYPYPVFESPRLPLLSPKLKRLLHLCHHHRREKFDVVHAHILWPGLDYLIHKLHERYRLPVIVTPHGGDVQVVPEIQYGMCREPVVATSVRAALRAADLVSAVSQRIRTAAIERGTDADKVRVIPHGTEFEKIQRMQTPDLRTKLGLTGDDFVVLSVGRNSAVKDMNTLVEGFRLAADQEPRLKCILIGPDESLRDLVQRADLTDRVRLLGRVPTGYDPKHPTSAVFDTPYPELIAAYRACDVFVSTSYVESFNTSALDAFACGKPVIITNTQGFMDLIQEGRNGHSIPPRDPVALSEKLLKLARNRDECARMGLHALETARGYDWTDVAKRYVAVYEEAIGRASASSTKGLS